MVWHSVGMLAPYLASHISLSLSLANHHSDSISLREKIPFPRQQNPRENNQADLNLARKYNTNWKRASIELQLFYCYLFASFAICLNTWCIAHNSTPQKGQCTTPFRWSRWITPPFGPFWKLLVSAFKILRLHTLMFVRIIRVTIKIAWMLMLLMGLVERICPPRASISVKTKYFLFAGRYTIHSFERF